MELHHFQDPPKQYREVPFWSWNDVLDPTELRRQVAMMDEAGWGGFFMHARVGLKTPYMGQRWTESIKACVDEARRARHERLALRRGQVAQRLRRRAQRQPRPVAPFALPGLQDRQPAGFAGRAPRHLQSTRGRRTTCRDILPDADGRRSAATATASSSSTPQTRAARQPVVQRLHLPEPAQPRQRCEPSSRSLRASTPTGRRRLWQHDPRHLHRRACYIVHGDDSQVPGRPSPGARLPGVLPGSSAATTCSRTCRAVLRRRATSRASATTSGAP